MRAYLAAAFGRQQEMLELAKLLELSGIEVTSRWLHEKPIPEGNKDKFLRECAAIDEADLRASDVLVRFSDNLAEPTAPSNLLSGARMVETGMAFALGIPVIVVGGRQNVYDFRVGVVHLPDKEALLEYLCPEDAIHAVAV